MMADSTLAGVACGTLKDRDFGRLAAFIEGSCGIKMPAGKKTMVEGRLRRRLRALGIATFTEYCAWLFDGDGLAVEAGPLIDAITTNKTDFFREPEHFRILADQVLPRLIAGRTHGKPLRLWSAACSIGAEPYTLAMVLAEYAREKGGLSHTILATDICLDVLTKAVRGIYPEDMAAPVPPLLRRRYFAYARDRRRREVRVVPELRAAVRFRRLNLIEDTYPVDEMMDVVFCRNLLIYFDRPTQQAVLTRLCRHLRPGGFLFLGHSESIAGFDLPVRPLAATVFERRSDGAGAIREHRG